MHFEGISWVSEYNCFHLNSNLACSQCKWSLGTERTFPFFHLRKDIIFCIPSFNYAPLHHAWVTVLVCHFCRLTCWLLWDPAEIMLCDRLSLAPLIQIVSLLSFSKILSLAFLELFYSLIKDKCVFLVVILQGNNCLNVPNLPKNHEPSPSIIFYLLSVMIIQWFIWGLHIFHHRRSSKDFLKRWLVSTDWHC